MPYLQHYVEQKEGKPISYWSLVHKNVLVPLGAGDFSLLKSIEPDSSEGIPLLAYGAWPTLDNAAKIALLFANEGNHKGQQLIHKEKCKEALGRTYWKGYDTGNDYRGKYYRHSFWATSLKTDKCIINLTYMLGYDGNYVWFLPSGTIAIRFMDEYDLNFSSLIKHIEKIQSSCS